MKVQGRENADWGSRIIEPGWYEVEAVGPVEAKVNDNSGKTSMWIPLTVHTPDGDMKATIFAPVGNFGEQKVADTLLAAGVLDKFEAKFPGDVSVFEPAFIAGMNKILIGLPFKVKFDTDKKGNSNIVQLATIGTDTKKLDLAANSKKGGKSGKTAADLSGNREAPQQQAKDDWDD